MQDGTLPERIAHRLRRDILRGRLAPGAPIKERDTAAALGASRTPMREAVRMLAREGLVVLRPARSPVVAELALKEVTDAVTVLSALELLSVRLACAAATEAELAEIAALQARMVEGFPQLDPLDFFEIDMAFHRAVAVASHNAALAETHGVYLARLWRARYLSARQSASRERVLQQHGAIVAGLEARDPEAAAAALQAHLDRLETNVRAYFADREAPAGTKEGDKG